MSMYNFDVILNDASEITDEQADALFSAGCDDGTPFCSNNVALIHFDREASSLEQAIRSACAQVNAAGLRVARIEIDPNSLLSLDV